MSRPTPPCGWPPTPDQLTSGSEVAPRRWPGWLLAGLALVLLGGYTVDGRLQDRELDLLLRRIDTAQSTATYAENRVAATATYASPQLTAPGVPLRVRRSLEQLVEDEAAGQLAAVQRAGEAVGTSVLPWHGTVRKARDRYQRYAAHRLAVLRDASRDAGALRRPHPELTAELSGVRAALTAAGASAQQVAEVLGPA